MTVKELSRSIVSSARQRTLFRKGLAVLRRLFFKHALKNQNTVEEEEAVRSYRRLRKAYATIIEKGVSAGESHKSNNIWICWLQGADSMPSLVQKCVQSIFENFPDKTVTLISYENMNEYVDLPDYIIRKHKDGIIPPAQFSDLIRADLLCKYGGLWVDATVFCTSPNMFRIFEEYPLFVFKQFDLQRRDFQPSVASNWLIYAYSNQKILLLTRKLLFEYWERNNYLENYFIFHHFFALAAKRYEEDWNAIPAFNNHTPHTLQFEFGEVFSEERWGQIKGMSDFHKLNHHINYSDDEKTFYSVLVDNKADFIGEMRAQ